MGRMQQKTILIIETHEALQMLYEAELQEAGFNTLLASNTAEAQHLLASNSVDLLMADLPALRAADINPLTLLVKANNIPLLINTSYPLDMLDQSVVSAAALVQKKSSDIDKLKDKVIELLGNAQSSSPSLHENSGQQAIAGTFDGHTRNHLPTVSPVERGLG